MPQKYKTTDWKKKIKDVCPCFVSTLEKPSPSHEPCQINCPMEELKLLLLQIETPTRKEIVKAMVKSGLFKKKEITFALLEIHDTIYRSAERRVEEAIAELKLNYKVVLDDQKCLRTLPKE